MARKSHGLADPPAFLRWLNAAGEGARALGIDGEGLLDPDSLLGAAERLTGLDDFGPEAFRDGLDRLVDACEREARLTLLGAVALRYQLVRLLSNRLRIQAELTKNPSIREVPIPPPIVVAGMPRTGTTLLQRLLSQDPRARAPQLWELYTPTRLPRKPWDLADHDRERRVARAASMLRTSYAVAPQLRDIHPMEAEEAEECHFLLQHTFVSEIFHLQFEVPSYVRWVLSLGPDRMREVYGYHRTLLQILLQHDRGDHLVLKYPGHLLQLDVLLATYPNACIVQTHRNPLEFVPSTCSLFAYTRGARAEVTDLADVGRDGVAFLRETLGRALRSRERIHPSRAFDVSYSQLVGDPVGTVRAIYEHFGLLFEPVFERRMRDWLARHPSSGSPKYSLEQFGLDREELAREFAEYCRKYDVPHGPSRRDSAGPSLDTTRVPARS